MNIDIPIKPKVRLFYMMMKEKRLAFLKLFVSLFKNLETSLFEIENLEDLNRILKNIHNFINLKLWLSYYYSLCKHLTLLRFC